MDTKTKVYVIYHNSLNNISVAGLSARMLNGGGRDGR